VARIKHAGLDHRCPEHDRTTAMAPCETPVLTPGPLHISIHRCFAI
jgi:hypothetical protein